MHAIIILIHLIVHFTAKLECVLKDKKYPGFLHIMLHGYEGKNFRYLMMPIPYFEKYFIKDAEKLRIIRNIIIFTLFIIIILMGIYAIIFSN